MNQTMEIIWQAGDLSWLPHITSNKNMYCEKKVTPPYYFSNWDDYPLGPKSRNRIWLRNELNKIFLQRVHMEASKEQNAILHYHHRSYTDSSLKGWNNRKCWPLMTMSPPIHRLRSASFLSVLPSGIQSLATVARLSCNNEISAMCNNLPLRPQTPCTIDRQLVLLYTSVNLPFVTSATP